jgi:uncharacterized phage protein (TIGR02218 family)
LTRPQFRTPVNFSGIYDATSLLTYLEGSTLSLAICAAFTPTVGSAVGVTTNTRDISGLTGYGGITFKSLNGVAPSQLDQVSGVSATNIETSLLITSTGITEADIIAGKWSNAQATIFMLNYDTPTMGQLILAKGTLPQFAQAGQVWKATLKGWNNALNANILRLTRLACDADFGDARCGLDIVGLGFVNSGTVTTGGSQTTFTDSGRTESTATSDYYTNGKILFNTGFNAGYTFQVDDYNESTKVFNLRFPTPYVIQVGDTYTATRGCQKRMVEDCSTKFSNAVNHRGFPYIPPPESINLLPTS